MYNCPELKFEKIFHLWSFLVQLWGFIDCQFGTINARFISRYKRVSGNLIGLRNQSKLVERSLFAIIDLLQGAKLSFFSYYGVWGDDFYFKKIQIKKKINCSINPKRQSEHSGLRLIRAVLFIFLLLPITDFVLAYWQTDLSIWLKT